MVVEKIMLTLDILEGKGDLMYSSSEVYLSSSFTVRVVLAVKGAEAEKIGLSVHVNLDLA